MAVQQSYHRVKRFKQWIVLDTGAGKKRPPIVLLARDPTKFGDPASNESGLPSRAHLLFKEDRDRALET